MYFSCKRDVDLYFELVKVKVFGIALQMNNQ